MCEARNCGALGLERDNHPRPNPLSYALSHFSFIERIWSCDDSKAFRDVSRILTTDFLIALVLVKTQRTNVGIEHEPGE